MSDDRRSFIRKFGLTLGSLIVSGSLPGCGRKTDEALPNARSPVSKHDEPTSTARTPQWEQLRYCWLNLNNTDHMKAALTKESEASTRDAMLRRHQAILDALVATGQVKKPVAEHMQMAFEEAVKHVIIIVSAMMCYYAIPLEFSPREDLLQQAETLRKIYGDLDPATAAKAQAAIAQDVAFFEIFKSGHYDKLSLAQEYGARGLEASPEALEAARLLTQLFLGAPDSGGGT